MKTPILTRLAGSLFIALLFIYVFSSCKKNIVEEQSLQDESLFEKAESAGNSGLFVSAADTAAAVKNLYYYDATDPKNIMENAYASGAKDGNGVWYNQKTDEVYQLSRKNKTIYVFPNASSLTDPPVASRTINDITLSSGREIAYDRWHDVLFVSNNIDSTIRVYRNFSMLSGSITGEVLKISGQPWGIVYDENTDKLLVVIDLAAMRIEVYDAPASLSAGIVAASSTFNVTNRPNGTFSRLHGIAYNSKKGIMLVTEIGEAVAPPTPTPGKPLFNADGGIYVFKNVNAKINAGGSYAANAVIYGANTGLGNPVDIDMRTIDGTTYIIAAEKANKKLQTFKLRANGDEMPYNTIITSYAPEAITGK